MDAFEAVSAPGLSSARGKRYFTPAEATRALPLVRRIVTDIVRDYRQFRELHETCRSPRGKGKSPDAEKARAKYLAITDRLSDLKEELDKVGCELKDCQAGLIDFPGRLEGREICLCWKLGEEKVAHWHELDTGYGGRRPIDEAVFGA
jgi:hypothetical protein